MLHHLTKGTSWGLTISVDKSTISSLERRLVGFGVGVVSFRNFIAFSLESFQMINHRSALILFRRHERICFTFGALTLCIPSKSNNLVARVGKISGYRITLAAGGGEYNDLLVCITGHLACIVVRDDS